MMGPMAARTACRYLAVAIAAVTLAACDSGGSGSPASTGAAPATSAPAPSAPPGSVDARCGTSVRVSVRLGQWAGPEKSVLPTATIGSGDTTAVFIHQTDSGLCGWWPYAAWVTSHYPVRAVLFELCDYGEARCLGGRFDANQLRQVAFAVAQARRAHPQRLVLVGASMGGALALAAATGAHADAVVDLSGPPDWNGADALPAARKLRVPLLIAASPGDPDADYAGLRTAYAAAPVTTKRFVVGDGPHGWELLSATGGADWRPLAGTVGRWIVGNYR
jgi:hypothetical protein